MTGLQPYHYYIAAFLGALAVSLFSIPNIIFVTKKKRLFDMPDNHRKLHKRVVPNLGGIGIFFAYIIITSLFIDPAIFPGWNYIVAASLVLFITGLKDDLVTISPTKKFVAQFAAALITASFADVRLQSLHGILGVYELPVPLSIAFSVVGCMFVTNAFNLIDGIDGLAGSIGMLITLLFGLSLAAEGNVSGAIVSFALMGAILGFLRFNIAPARIFMGDTGSLLIGFMVSVIGILFINSHHPDHLISKVIPTAPGAMIVALAVLFVPVFDTFRVFAARIAKGKSPFAADRTHLHHYLLDLGLTHSQTVGVIMIANLLIVSVALGVQRLNVNIAVACLLAVAFMAYGVLMYLRRGHFKATRASILHNTTLNSLSEVMPKNGMSGLDGHNAITHLTVEGRQIVLEEEVLMSED